MAGHHWYGLGLLLGAILLLGAGCDEGGGPAAPQRAGEPVPVVREFRGQQGPFPDAGYLVVQRPETWTALWGDRPAPEVDFTQYSVVAALMGQQATAGYEITITDIRATGQRINVYVTRRVPPPNEIVAQVLTYPYHFAVVPKLSQPVDVTVEGEAAPRIAIQDEFIGTQSRAVNPQTYVIRDGATWQQCWRTTFGEDAVAPALDFTQNMVVAVLAGQKPTAGYTVTISSVEETPERLAVTYRLRTPAPDAEVAQVITSPYAIAIVPTSGLPVAFRSATTPVVAATPPRTL